MSIEEEGRSRRYYETLQLCTFLRDKTEHEYILELESSPKLFQLLQLSQEPMDLSSLEKFAYDPSRFSSLEFDVKDVLANESAALSVWLLYSNAPLDIQMRACRLLRFVSCGTYDAIDICSDQSYESLLVTALGSKITDVTRQVCEALALVASVSEIEPVLTFGAAIQDQLLELVKTCDSDLMLSVLFAIAGIGFVCEDMRTKIVESEISCSWLVKLVTSRKDDKLIIERACWIVACLHCKFSASLWDHLKTIIRIIVDSTYSLKSRCCSCNCSSISCCCCFPHHFYHFYDYRDHTHLLRATASAILTITIHASRKQIRELVDLGGLKILFFALADRDDLVMMYCVPAIKKILKFGDDDINITGVYEDEEEEDEEEESEEDLLSEEEDLSKEEESEDWSEEEENEKKARLNKYAKMIDDYCLGWRMLILQHYDEFVNSLTSVKGRKLVEKYRPDLYW